MILDGMMIAFATILMTVAHPGVFFPAMGKRGRRRSGDQFLGMHAEEMSMLQNK